MFCHLELKFSNLKHPTFTFRNYGTETLQFKILHVQNVHHGFLEMDFCCSLFSDLLAFEIMVFVHVKGD